jgi:hypothetical protein
MVIHRNRDGRTHQSDDAEKPTRLISHDPVKQAPAVEELNLRPAPMANEQTHLYGAADEVRGKTDAAMQNPVVGWLVITGGPGQGRALVLGYGMNSIGRGPESRVRLDFGDKQISRADHALVSYDPRGRRFYIQHGGGTNLTYLNDQPVLSPTELKGGEIIQLGKTRLHFVPFCGPAFDWQDIDPEAP